MDKLMKNCYYINLFIALLCSTFLLGACSDDDKYPSFSIDLNGAPDQYEYVNENGILEIPLHVESEAGLKSAYYKLATKDAEGDITIGSQVDIPVSGNVLDETIKIQVVKGLSHIIFAVFDNDDQLYKRTIYIDEVKNAPVVSFKDGVDERAIACVGIPFDIRGEIQSEYELESVWATTVVNGADKDVIQAPVASSFEISIPVEAGLQMVKVSAQNVYGGVDTKEFKVLSVVDEDFVSVVLGENVSATDGDVVELNRVFRGKTNLINGQITSGSNIVSMKYAEKTNGSLGEYKDVQLTDNLGNEANFSFELVGDRSLEAVEVVVTNEGGVTQTETYNVSKVAYLNDVTMSSDPEDGTCFLSLFEADPVFGVDEALSLQDRVDFYLANKGSGVQPLSPHAYGAGDAYYNASLPYIKGFTTLTYSYLSSIRGKLVRDEFESVQTEDELMELLEYRIIGPNPDGENYNIRTASRRVGDTFNTTNKSQGGFILGWGSHTHPTVSPAVVDNEAFAVFWLKSVQQKANGHWIIVFDVKYPLDDERAIYTEGSIVPYDPYPL